MKIGILTFHRSINYGAFLQSYALQHSLQNNLQGTDVEIIDYESKASVTYSNKRILMSGFPFGFFFYLHERRVFKKAQEKLVKSAEHVVTDDLNVFTNTYRGKYDLIVVGSDQVWVTDGFRGFPNAYWLPYDMECIKVSYAASSRSDFSKLTGMNQLKLRGFLESFSYVGVRDDCTKREIDCICGNDRAEINCDPVFAWDFGNLRDHGKHILSEKCRISAEDKVAAVMMAPSNTSSHIVNVLKKSGYKVVAFHYKQKGAINVILDPFEWVAVISALDGFVTSFFHGTCFAIKYNIPFVSLEERSKNRERSKMYDLLRRIKLEDRYFNNVYKFTEAVNKYIINAKPEKFDDNVAELKALFEKTISEYSCLLKRVK